MTVSVTSAIGARLLLPTVAVVLAYATCFVLPRHRENQRLAAASQQQLAAVEALRARVNAQQQDAAHDRPDPDSLAGVASRLATIKTAMARQRSDHSAMQAFAGVLAVFGKHEISCTSALPAGPEHGEVSSAAVMHRVLLSGGFRDMLAALEVIESELPYALAAEFSMRREEPNAACRWEFAFRFCEGLE